MRLSDLGTIITGKTPTTKKEEYWNGNVPFVTPGDIQGIKHIFKTTRNVTEEGMQAVKGAILPPNAVCVSCIGNIGYVGITTKKCVSNQQINSIIVSEDHNHDYVFYLIKSLWPFFKHYEGQSTTLSIMNKTQFSQIEVPDFTRLQEDRIAETLCALDDKIEHNNAINENLSDQIQAIYSNEFDPTTHTPSGVLADICSYSLDRIPVSELSVSTYFSTENMQPNKMGFVDATSLPSITQTTRCHKGDVLISNIRPYFKKIVYVTDDRCGCSTDVLCFVPKEAQYSAFLFGTLYMDRFFDYMVAGSKGTKMPRGDKQQIMNYPVVLPDKESLNLFNGLVVPMLDQIATNRIESSRLAELRDALLPKLMSGELDVSELDI